MKNLFKVNVLIVLCLFVGTVYSQHKVSGTVTDAKGDFLPNANVLIINIKGNKLIKGTITNDKGQFESTVGKGIKCKVVIRYIGFLPYEKSLLVDNNINLGNIKMKQSVNSLNEVTIQAKKNVISVKDDKIVFNVKNSPFGKDYKVIELLQISPFVWVNDNDITIRGEQAIIMVNGRAVGSSYLDNISSDKIEKIEIQTNQSADVDATTSGGVINIVLKKVEYGLLAALRTYYTLKNKANNSGASLAFTFGQKDWNMYGNYSFNRYKFFAQEINKINFLDENNLINTETDKNNLSFDHYYTFGVGKEINKNHQIGFEIYGSHSKNNLDRIGNTKFFHNNVLTDDGIIDVRGNGNYNMINAVFNYKWKISEKDDLKVFVDYSNNRSNDNNLTNTSYSKMQGSVADYSTTAKTKVSVFQSDYNKKLPHNTKLKFGVKFTNVDRFNEFTVKSNNVINSEESNKIKYIETVGAAYVMGEKNINDKNYLKIGLRLENTGIKKTNLEDNTKFKDNYYSLFPSVYYSLKFNKNNSLSFGYNRTLQRPQFSLLNDNVIKINDFQFNIGNPNLTPEFTQKYELSYYHKKHSFSVYYNSTKDKITDTYVIKDNIAYYKPVNLGTRIKYGFDYNFSASIKKWWYMSFSAFVYNGLSNDINYDSSFKKTTYGGNIFSKFTIDKTTSISLSGFYTSPQSMTFYEGTEIYAANISMKKTFLNNNLHLSISANDIFNTRGLITTRKFDTFHAYYEKKPNRRSFMIHLTYYFSNNKKVREEENESKNDLQNRI